MSLLKDNSLDPDLYVDMETLRRLRYEARGFSFLPRQPATSALSGKNASRLRGRGLNFEELRHYRPGDDIRAMDWKTTKRTGKPHIKVYTEERERQVFLVVDQRSTMFFGSQGQLKSVVAAKAAALIAWQVESSGDRIGAVIYSDDKVTAVPARRGGNHTTRLLSSVVDFNQRLNANKALPNAEKTLNSAFGKLPALAGHNALIVFVGDGYGWSEATTTIVKRLRQHNEVVACNIIDPLEMELPQMRQMVVTDGDKQIQFSSADSSIHSKYRNLFESQISDYERVARKYRIPFISLDTLSPVGKQLRKSLGGLG